MTPQPDDRARVAQLLEAAGLGAMRTMVPLAGTGNRTFGVRGDGFEVVVRLPGHDTAGLVDRIAEACNAALAAERGVAPAIVHRDPIDGAMVMRRVAGPTLATLPQGARGDALGRLGQSLARLHRGPAFLGTMDPWQKVAAYLGAAGLGDGADPAAFGELWPHIGALRARCFLEPARLAPCHVDPNLANAIDEGGAVLLVDWEYSAMSEPLWDLAYVCVEGGLTPAEEAALLAGYGSAGAAGRALADWKLVARTVSAAWCMARAAAAEDAAPWRAETAKRLAGLARDLDDAAANDRGAGR